jgi:hypothetical protein
VDNDQDRHEIDRRLFEALFTAGRSALGMPSSVDTFNFRRDRPDIQPIKSRADPTEIGLKAGSKIHIVGMRVDRCFRANGRARCAHPKNGSEARAPPPPVRHQNQILPSTVRGSARSEQLA